MAYLLPLPAKAGKTAAAARFTFVPEHSLDVVRACAFFGGSFDSMKPDTVGFLKRKGQPLKAICHNYYPTLSDPKFWPSANLPVKTMFNAYAIQGSAQQRSFCAELNRQLRNGVWYMFQDGYYVSSALLNLQLDESTIAASANQNGTEPCWDQSGIGVEFFRDEKNDTVLNDITMSLEKQYVGPEPATYMVIYTKREIDGVAYRNVTHIFIRADALAYCRGVKFDGVPYIKVTETAVSEPRGVVIPRIMREKQSSVTKSLRDAFDKRLDKELQNAKQLAKTSVQAAHAQVIAAAAQLQQQEEYLLYTAFANSEPLEKYEIDTANPSRTEDQYLVVFPFNGTPTVRYGLALLKLFGSSRCFVDAVTTLALTAGGNAISGGAAGAFLAALQNSTESEAILIYSLSPLNDPMAKYNPEGLVNGSFATQKSDSVDASKWLSDKPLALYSRNAPSRVQRYWFVNQKLHEVYALDYVYNFETGVIKHAPGVAYAESNKCDDDLEDITFVSKSSTLNKRKPIEVRDTLFGIVR